MSYWIYIEETPRSSDDELFCANITYNLSPMWHAAGVDIRALSGKDARHCASVIGDGLARLKADPDRFKAMNAPNGWGRYENLVKLFSDMLGVLREYPNATVRVS